MTNVLDAEIEAHATLEPESRVRTAIAILVSRFPRLDETFILREINELERQGQPVVLVPMLRGSGKVLHEEAKPWLRRALYTPLFSLAILASNLRALITDPLRYLRLLFKLITGTCIRPRTLLRTLAIFPKGVHLARILPATGVKHVHAHFATHATTLAYIISSLSDLTFSFTVHGPDVFVHRLLLAEKIRKAKFVRAISMFNKAFLAGLYPEQSEKIAVAHMGLSPDVYARAADESPHEPDAPLRILSVATLLPNKGFMFLVEACAQLIREGMKLECRIVGDGPRRAALQRWIDDHGLSQSVFLVGAVPQNEVAKLMGECDVFVLPSIIALDGQMDGIPMSLIEAMAAGRPVVAASISGIPELVTNGVSGVLVDATHTTRIAQSIRILNDAALRERLGRAAQQKVRAEFDVRRTAEQVIALFDHTEDNARDEDAASLANMTWPGARFRAVGLRRLHVRRDSLVAEVTVSDGSEKRELVIKQQRTRDGESRPASVRARHELGVMRLLRESLDKRPGDISFSVPDVEAFDEDHSALLVARAQGTALDTLIRNARNRGKAVSRLTLPLRRTGAWLRAMHDATRVDDDGRHLLTAVLVLALQDLDLAAAADRRLRREHDAIIAKLRQLESRVAEKPMPVVGHHGDYWPGNVFIGERRVEVIDFEGFREGLPLEDVGYFLVMLELPFAYPFFRAPLPRLSQSFLDGYLGADLPLDRDALRLFTAMKALQILARGGAAARTGLRAAYLRRVLVDIVRRNLA